MQINLSKHSENMPKLIENLKWSTKSWYRRDLSIPVTFLKKKKITGNEVSTISSHSTSHTRIILCCPIDKSFMQFIPYSVVYMYLTMAKICVNFIIFSAVQIYENSLTRKSVHRPYWNSFVCPCTQSFCVIVIKSFK